MFLSIAFFFIRLFLPFQISIKFKLLSYIKAISWASLLAPSHE